MGVMVMAESDTDDKKSNNPEAEVATDDREFNLDTSGLELLPAGTIPGAPEKLPGQ